MNDLVMRTARVIAAGLAVSALSIAGCAKKAEDKPADKAAPKADEKPADKPAAAAPAGCSAGAYKHTSPNFCLEAPAGFEPQPEKKAATGGTELPFTRKSDDYSFVLSWGRFGSSDEAVKAVKSAAPLDNEKVVEQADLPGGGYFKHTSVDDYHFVSGVSVGKTGYVSCYVETKLMDVITPVAAACKSLRVD